MHKNVSYRPSDDAFRGASGDGETVERLHGIMRNYSRQVLDFLAKFLSPYAKQWILDFSSFRPLEEQGRDLPLAQTKRSVARRCISEPAHARRAHPARLHEFESEQIARLGNHGPV